MKMLRNAGRVWLSIAVLSLAATGARAELRSEQRAEFEALIQEYLDAHPEVVQDALNKLERRRGAADLEKRKGAVAANAASLFNSGHQVTLGDRSGVRTVVEFFDYNCPYCKRAMPNLLDLMKADPKLKVVLKEFPVLGSNSLEAAKVAVAVRMQDETGERYLDFHKRLLTENGPVNRDGAMAAARAAGADMTRLERDVKSDEVSTSLEESRQLAGALGIRGTPSYVIGDEVIVGAVALPVLQDKLRRAQK
jgi:protein-disulfide isomerase